MLGYWTYGCDNPSQALGNGWGNPILVWEPEQNIGGGEEPVIPDGGDLPGEGDDPFDGPSLPVEHTVKVTVVHQKTDGSVNTNTTVQNMSFTVLTGESLDQSTAQSIISPNNGFTFNESQITLVDGNTHNTPVNGVASYVDGVSGDTLTTNLQSIQTSDLVVAGVTVVKVSFTFETLIVNSDTDITIIIKGNATDLSAAEVVHQNGVAVFGLVTPEDNIQAVFGDGSSGEMALVQAPDGNYSQVAPQGTQISPQGHLSFNSNILGTSSIGVERTVGTVTLKTSSGHRFVTDGDLNGFHGFLESAGIGLTPSSSHGDRIAAWLNAHAGLIILQNNSAAQLSLYTYEFAVTITNSGASNVQEQIVVTIKYTGDGNPAIGSTMLFRDKRVRLIAVDYNNPNYS